MIKKLGMHAGNSVDNWEDTGRVTGFASPADDYKQNRLHIANMLVKDPVNTYYFKADNDKMRHFGIPKGSLIVVDRSIAEVSGMLIVCSVKNEWIVRKLIVESGKSFLCTSDDIGSRVSIMGQDIVIFGVVTWTCIAHLQ